MKELPPTPEQWARIEGLFQEALELAPGDRSTFLKNTRDRDPVLAIEVERLLDLHQTDDGFLAPVTDWNGPRTISADPHAMSDRRVGAFKLIKPIATGGMASVWLAERDDAQFDQRVAVKLIHWGLATTHAVRRFHLERQALARLEHPCITRLIDGGTLEEGLPFLVMEYVDGLPIDQYCDQQRLTLRDRLDLFRKVCSAVHYAHQNLIVHRDLKPSNILVREDGTPKLLDFGIAKLLGDGNGQSVHEATQTLFRVLTPRYASPEQTEGGIITTATDVYSLGVILYELLSGQHPFGSGTGLSGHTVGELAPEPPSSVVGRTETHIRASGREITITPEQAAHLRRESPKQLRGRLRGDLDSIVMLALRKDPKRRYASVQQLSEDLDRYLGGLPVVAQKETVRYRVGKFVKRNKAAVVASLALLLSLVAGVVGTGMGLAQARLERDNAVKVTAFIQDVLASANPYGSGQEATVSELLANVAERIEADLAGQPSVEAPVRYILARTHAGLWEWPQAERHVKIALQRYKQLHGNRQEQIAECLTLLGRAMTWLNSGDAVAIQREALNIRTALFGEDHPAVAETKSCLAYALWANARPQQWDEAAGLYRDAIRVYRDHDDPDPSALALTLYSFGAMRQQKEDFGPETEALLKESVALSRELSPPRDRYSAEPLRAYSYLLKHHGRAEEEVAILEEYIDRTPAPLETESAVRGVLWRLAELHASFGDERRSAQWYRRALAAECLHRSRTYPDDTGRWKELSAALSQDIGLAQIAGLAEEILFALTSRECCGRQLNNRLIDLASFVCSQGHYSAAESLLEVCRITQEEHFPDDSARRAVISNSLGACLMHQQRYDKAESLLIGSFDAIQTGLSRDHPQSILATKRLIRFCEDTGKPAEAAKYRAKLERGR